LRLKIELAGGPSEAVWFWDRRGLGTVRLVTAEQFQQRYGLDRLGPDALGLSAPALRERLGTSRRAIKVALLDQRALAGVGNLYASELLHLARVHPAARCDQLRAAAWQRIAAAMSQVLEAAIRYEGSTLGDGTYRNALNEAGGYQNMHRVYDRADQACPSCGKAKIVRFVQAQRSTFFCPRCQRTGA
jgi:formamidopyrimidine-DNA glycosylase